MLRLISLPRHPPVPRGLRPSNQSTDDVLGLSLVPSFLLSSQSQWGISKWTRSRFSLDDSPIRLSNLCLWLSSGLFTKNAEDSGSLLEPEPLQQTIKFQSQCRLVRIESELPIHTSPLRVELGDPRWRFCLWQTRKRDRRHCRRH